jgi:hypothetical protein
MSAKKSISRQCTKHAKFRIFVREFFNFPVHEVCSATSFKAEPDIIKGNVPGREGRQTGD